MRYLLLILFLGGCATPSPQPILVFQEDTIDRYEPNAPIPSRPYPCVVTSKKKFKELTDPR